MPAVGPLSTAALEVERGGPNDPILLRRASVVLVRVYPLLSRSLSASHRIRRPRRVEGKYVLGGYTRRVDAVQNGQARREIARTTKGFG